MPLDLAAVGDAAALAEQLDRAAGEMARRVPVALEAPLPLVVERDFVAQALAAGVIGEAVAGPGGDLHLVLHPRDGFAYRHAIGRVLLERAGLVPRLPPWK